MDEYILGIDVSKDTLDVVLRDQGHSQHQVFSNNTVGYGRLSRWLIAQKTRTVHACLEATGQYGEGVAEYLYGAGHAVSVVNPVRIKRYGESKLHRNKTDKADAALIAEFCFKENPPLWKPLPDSLKQLRQMVRRLDDLQCTYQQERNRLTSGVDNAWVVADLQGHLQELRQRIQALKTAIQQFIAADPELKHQADLLDSIPGIGTLTAARLLAEIGEITSFKDAPQLAAYAGLNPSQCTSGTSVHRRGRLSRIGKSSLRKALYFPAISAMRFNPQIRTFCDRLEERHKPSMVIIAAAMRKLLCLALGVLKSGLPFDPNYAQDACALP